MKSIAKVEVSIWVVGLKLNSSVVGGNGSIYVALLLISIAQAVISFWELGFS